jgi:hypothetical protein
MCALMIALNGGRICAQPRGHSAPELPWDIRENRWAWTHDKWTGDDKP